MKTKSGIIILSALIVITMMSCKDKMEIQQDYPFTVKTMPVKKKVKVNETTEIRCKLQRDGIFVGAEYYIRYFQYDGNGIIKLENTELTPNDFIRITSDDFILYYTSLSAGQQNIDFFIEDNFGQLQTFSVTFQNEREDEKNNENNNRRNDENKPQENKNPNEIENPSRNNNNGQNNGNLIDPEENNNDNGNPNENNGNEGGNTGGKIRDSIEAGNNLNNRTKEPSIDFPSGGSSGGKDIMVPDIPNNPNFEPIRNYN